MKKENILKKNEEFNRIINSIKPERTNNFNLYLERNTSENYFFGFVVGKKLGNAVTRNYIKRRIKNIVGVKKYKKGFICIIMCKKNTERESYVKLEEELDKYFSKHNLYEENIC